MKGLEKMIMAEEQRLLRIKNDVDGRLSCAPEGTLKITHTGKHTQYILCTNDTLKSKRQGIYIRKSEGDTIRKLAQKAYDKKIKRIVDRRINQIQAMRKEYRDNELQEVFESMSECRKQLVNPVEIPYEQALAQWKSVPYIGKGFEEGFVEIYTIKGERVRSKSEKILADTFYHLGIEYKYECPICLNGYGTIYPDFTFLSRKTGREIYWEHDGRMDDPEYAEKAVRKIDSYIKNGIVPGDRLIVTFETSNVVLSDVTIKNVIERFIL